MLALHRTMLRIRAFEDAAEEASRGGVAVLGDCIDHQLLARLQHQDQRPEVGVGEWLDSLAQGGLGLLRRAVLVWVQRLHDAAG
jgi:hypothetical protein